MKYAIFIIIVSILVITFKAGELYSQLSRYKNYWDKNNNQKINENDLVYVAFGDSAAQGVGATKPEKGYVGLVYKHLKENNNNSVKLINLSKSGAKISDVLNIQLKKYQDLNITNKQVISVDIGANDILDFDPNRLEKEAVQLLDNLPKGALISDVPSFGGSRLNKYEARVIEANKIMHRVARSKGIDLLPLYNQTKSNSGLSTFAIDFFHPSDKGYRTNWAPLFISRIKL